MSSPSNAQIILSSLKNRKSVRAFEERGITEEIKAEILEAAFQAPTAGNQMLYTILDITDQTLKVKLSETCDNQTFIAKAPLVLVFLADCRRWLDAYRYAGCEVRSPGVGDLLLACQDAAIAAQNSVIAAEAYGIGSCYIGDILEQAELVQEILQLDKWVVPITMVIYGYPTDQQKTRHKPYRFDKQYIVQQNTYKPLDESQMRDMFERRSQASSGHLAAGLSDYPNPSFDFDDYVSTFATRKYMSEFSREMSRSAALYLAPFLQTNADLPTNAIQPINADMSTPESVVSLQIDYYNDNDLMGFASTYHPDIEIYDLPAGTLRYSGRENLIERYREPFTKKPHARIAQRTVEGNKVIDHEFFIREGMEKEGSVVAIYEVEETLIRRVWFLK